jgi:hypothetical protein
MNTKKAEGADQKDGHEPENIEEIRIFVPIMVGGMGQVTNKFSVRLGMTRFAGGHDILTTQGRIGIERGQNIVRAVAIETFGGSGGTKLRDLAMEGIKIGLGHILMAFAAFLNDIVPEIIAIGSTDGMRQMAIIADREFFVGFSDERTVDALL